MFGRLWRCVDFVGLCAGICGVAPAVASVEVIRRLLSGDHDILWIVTLAAIAVASRIAAFIAAAVAAHLADIRLGFAIRRALLDHIRRVPLSWFTAGRSGEVTKAVEDDVAALHHLVAHASVEIPMAVAGPVTALVYLAVLDLRAAASPPSPSSSALSAIAGRCPAARPCTRVRHRLGAMVAAIVEFANGPAVVRVFADGTGAPPAPHRGDATFR